jgi:hypothetical protein
MLSGRIHISVGLSELWIGKAQLSLEGRNGALEKLNNTASRKCQYDGMQTRQRNSRGSPSRYLTICIAIDAHALDPSLLASGTRRQNIVALNGHGLIRHNYIDSVYSLSRVRTITSHTFFFLR